MIKLSQTSKIFPLPGHAPVAAVREVDLSLPPRSFAVITGRSGSGKTTLLNLIGGLTRPTSGSVMVNRTQFWSLSDQQQSLFRNRTIGFVFQFPSLLPNLTALENVILPALFEARAKTSSLQAHARNLLALVGLSDKSAAFPRQLSAGQQQRVVIARALINRPPLLLADEPTSNLDEQTELEIMALLQEIHRTQDLTIVMVTHNRQLRIPEALFLEMAEGRLHSVAEVPTLKTQPV